MWIWIPEDTDYNPNLKTYYFEKTAIPPSGLQKTFGGSLEATSEEDADNKIADWNRIGNLQNNHSKVRWYYRRTS